MVRLRGKAIPMRCPRVCGRRIFQFFISASVCPHEREGMITPVSPRWPPWAIAARQQLIDTRITVDGHLVDPPFPRWRQASSGPSESWLS